MKVVNNNIIRTRTQSSAMMGMISTNLTPVGSNLNSPRISNNNNNRETNFNNIDQCYNNGERNQQKNSSYYLRKKSKKISYNENS